RRANRLGDRRDRGILRSNCFLLFLVLLLLLLLTFQRTRKRKRKKRFSDATQGGLVARLHVPLELDLEHAFLFATVESQNAVGRNLPDRFAELEIILVFEPLRVLKFLVLGRRQLAGFPEDG